MTNELSLLEYKTIKNAEYAGLIQKNVHDEIMMQVADGSYKDLSDDELIALYRKAKTAMNFFKMMQMVVKLLCNSVYGGFGTASLRYFLQVVASDICSEGRDVCQVVDRMANKYFQTKWTNDPVWFGKLKEEFSDIIPAHIQTPKALTKDCVVYCDTDSVIGSTVLRSDSGKLSIEELYNESSFYKSDEKGNEFAKTNKLLLNYTEENKLYYANVKNVIRHKVTKAKWKLKTKSGKEVIVTNDHSMVVFREGTQLTVKPAEILITDKILAVNEKSQ